MGAIAVAVAMQIGLARKAPFPKKVTRSQNRHNGFFAGLIDHSELYTAFLNVHDILRGIALREDGFFSSKLAYLLPRPAESRNNFTSKAGLLEFAFWGERWALTDTRLAAALIIGKSTIARIRGLSNVLQQSAPTGFKKQQVTPIRAGELS